MYDGILIREMAERMGVASADIQKILLKQGILANLNQPLSQEMAFQVAEQMGMGFGEVRAVVVLEERHDAGFHLPPRDLDAVVVVDLEAPGDWAAVAAPSDRILAQQTPLPPEIRVDLKEGWARLARSGAIAGSKRR